MKKIKKKWVLPAKPTVISDNLEINGGQVASPLEGQPAGPFITRTPMAP